MKEVSRFLAILLIVSLLSPTSVSSAKPPCNNLQKSELTKLQLQAFQTKTFLTKAKEDYIKAKSRYDQNTAAGSQSGASRAKVDMEAAQIRIDRFNRALDQNDGKVNAILSKCDNKSKSNASSSITKQDCSKVENATLKTIVLQYQIEQDTKRLLNAKIKEAQTSGNAQGLMNASRYIQEYQIAITKEVLLERQFQEIISECKNSSYQLPAAFEGDWTLRSTSSSETGSNGSSQSPLVEQCRDIPQVWLSNPNSLSYSRFLDMRNWPAGITSGSEKETRDWRIFTDGVTTTQWDTRYVKTESKNYWTRELLPLAVLGSPSFTLTVTSPKFEFSGTCSQPNTDNLYTFYSKGSSTQVEVDVASITPEVCTTKFVSSKGNRFGKNATISGRYVSGSRFPQDSSVTYRIEMNTTGICTFQVSALGTEHLKPLEPLIFMFEIQKRITCIKGKDSLEILGRIPQCPSGYRPK